jgi:hypothetical protein
MGAAPVLAHFEIVFQFVWDYLSGCIDGNRGRKTDLIVE